MGQTPALKPLFNDIAAAIHEKDGQTGGIAAKDFPARIRAIPSGQSGASWAYGYDKNFSVWSAYIKIRPERQLVLCEGNYEVLEGADA